MTLLSLRKTKSRPISASHSWMRVYPSFADALHIGRARDARHEPAIILRDAREQRPANGVMAEIRIGEMLIKSALFKVSVLAVIMAGLVAVNPFGRNLAQPTITGSITTSAIH